MTKLEEVKKRLESFGYKTSESDDFALNFVISKIDEYIKNFCNIKEIPEEINYAFIDMVCSEFLLEKKSSGSLNLSDLDFSSPAIKSISEGDTSVTYAFGDGTMTNEQKLDVLVNYLADNFRKELYRFRRFVW